MFDFGIISVLPTVRVYQIVLLMRQPRRSPMPYMFRSGAAFSLGPPTDEDVQGAYPGSSSAAWATQAPPG
jgi:hypothetical protein